MTYSTAPDSGGHPDYRPDVDGLRAFAVLAVVAFHLSPPKVPGGFVGVDVFFVISGYLISGLIFKRLERGGFTYADFYARRIRRIFPALIVVLLACLCAGWFALLATEYQSLGKHVAAAAVFVSNVLLFHETGYFDTSAELKPLLHLWSLGVEEQYYIVWPLVLYLIWRRRSSVIPLVAGVVVASFLCNVITIHVNQSAAFYLPFSRFWELALGCLLAYIELDRRAAFQALLERPVLRLYRVSIHLNDVLALIGALLLAGALALLNRDRLFPGWWALMPTAGALLLIAAGPQAWINRTLLAHKAVVYVGLISYPLYLWHWPLIAFARVLEYGQLSATLKLVVIALSFSFAAMTYEFVEKPIRFGRRPSSGAHSWRRPAALSAVMVLVASIALVLYAKDGFPDRVKDNLAAQQQAELIRARRTDARCEGYIGIQRQFEYCRLERADEKSELTAIIGDSHADTLFAGVSERLAVRNVGTLLLASSGCPPFLGTTVGTTSEEMLRCGRKTEQILDIVLAHPEIKSVIIATRGPLWITGRGFGLVEENLRLGIIAPAGATVPATSSGLATFEAGLERTVEVLRRNGKAVSYFLQVPELGVPPASCIRRPVELTHRNSCEVDLRLMNERHTAYRSRVQAVARSIAGFTVIDPFPIFCDSVRCRAFHDGHLLYADDNHLSLSGSRYVAKYLF